MDVTPKWPAGPEYYNSSITVNREGETLVNYRKSFLYYTDETWALESEQGFFAGDLNGLGRTSIGICLVYPVNWTFTLSFTDFRGARFRYGYQVSGMTNFVGT